MPQRAMINAIEHTKAGTRSQQLWSLGSTPPDTPQQPLLLPLLLLLLQSHVSLRHPGACLGHRRSS
jgi:hypothetical protein